MHMTTSMTAFEQSLIDQAFTRATGAERIEGNRVRLLRDAAENYPAWLDAIAAAHGQPDAGWRMAACDVDGCDLARDEAMLRVPWSSSVANASEIRAELVRIARDARAG